MILRDVTLSLSQGETFGLLGSSGSGKSTLARCIVGLTEPDGGVVRLSGETLWPTPAPRPPDPRIQLVFQASGQSLDPKMKIGPVIEEGFWPVIRTTPPRERSRQIAALLEAVDLNPAVLNSYPRELSGGQRQRVAFLRALASNAPLLILDEPTAALDPVTQRSVLSLLRVLKKARDLTLIFITHDRSLARSFCDRSGVLQDGVLTAS
jgi:peptide/nickel transport system ATP-binding protein